jgi:glycosyltransferase involved in cell wall biosynthesis
MELSIIIPCFNHGEYLLEAIANLDLQASNYEIIIINDGSTDILTLSILNGLKSKGYFILDQENQGLAQARNHGIAIAKGKYILPLDSDNKIDIKYISQGIEILDKFPEVAVVYGDVEFFGEQIGRWELPDFDLNRLMLGNYIDACAVFRKAVWQECGGYDHKIPDQLGYEDWDFWLSIAEKGWQFYHLSEVMYQYRVRGNSMVQTCKQPENQKRLVHYIASKHPKLYQAQYASLIAEKEFVAFKLMFEADSLRSQLQQSLSESAQSRHQALQNASDLERSRSQLELTQAELDRANQRVLAMESSKFWKLRSVWLRLKHKLGLSVND